MNNNLLNIKTPAESQASDPRKDGRGAHFSNVQVEYLEDAGHWVHHDRHDTFMAMTREFLSR